MDNTKEIMNKKELAEYLGYSYNTIDNFIKAGMPYLGKERSKRFVKAEVLIWMKNREERKVI